MQRLRFVDYAPAACAGVAVFISLLALHGWNIGSHALIAWSDDIATMKVNVCAAAILAAGIVNTVYTVDVERVVIGGGISAAGKVLFAPLRRAVLARTSHYKFDVNQIVPAELANDAGLIGAAVWARENLR